MVITFSDKNISSAIRDLEEAILDHRYGVVILEDLPSEDGELSWDWQDPDNYRLKGVVGLVPFDECLALLEDKPAAIAIVEIVDSLSHHPRFYHFTGEKCWDRLAAYGGKSTSYAEAKGEYRYLLSTTHEIKKATIHT